MADRFPGDITIGGNIPRRLLDELADMLASENVSIDWQYALDKAAVLVAIEDAAAGDQTVRFTNDEATGGQFEELEQWLTSHGINFDRHSDARYEYDGQNVYGRGRKNPVSMESNQSGYDMASADDIRKVLAGKKSPQQKLAKIARLIAVPEPLTPIVITD